jgi:hypothetical protein
MKLKTLMLSMFVLLIPVQTSAEEPARDGWWCETRAGYCYRTKEDCDDQSCHRRRHAWETAWRQQGTDRSQAFETEAMCKRFRGTRSERTTRCRYSD